MDRQRCVYVTARQKKKLLELIGNNPELISNKNRNGITHEDCQKTWQRIAAECNAIAGARKNWRQWRKTWQDLKSKTKKKSLANSCLTQAEQEVLGIKDFPTKTDSVAREETPEFIQLDEDILQDASYSNDMDYTGSVSEPRTPPETKVFMSERKKTKVKNNTNYKSAKHDDCFLNCNVITNMEERKLRVKEDYLKFKKDYLRQKLKLIKEQTEALKSIARELSK